MLIYNFMSDIRFKIWQIFYDKNSERYLDPGFIPYDNSKNNTIYYENSVIIDICKNYKYSWLYSDYVGVLSWRFREKTGLDFEYIKKTISNSDDRKDVYSMSPPMFNNSKSQYSVGGFHDLYDLCKLIDNHNLFPFKLAGYDSEFCKDMKCFCNYFICKPEIFNDYVENYLYKFYEFMQTCEDPEIVNILKTITRHRNKDFNVHPFLMEGLFECYVSYKGYSYEYIQDLTIRKTTTDLFLPNGQIKRRRVRYIPPPVQIPDIRNGVNLCGYINSDIGLGEFARKVEYLLTSENIPHNINDVNLTSHKKSSYYVCDSNNNYDINIISINPDNLSSLNPGYMNGKYNIGIWFWELDNLPDYWIKNADNFNEIWVFSKFIYNILIKNLPGKVIKIINIPPTIPDILDKDECKIKNNIETDEFLCLFIFDFCSDIHRKNPIAVIETFKRCFNSNEKARLIIKSQNGSIKDINIINDVIGDDSRITHIIECYTRDQINILMNACDVYISLHRSEGLGLTLMESILLEKPTLCTNYSGNLDFCKPGWSELVNFEMIDVDNSSHYSNELYKTSEKSKWADPIIDDAVNKLKLIYNNIDDYNRRAKIGKKWIIEEYPNIEVFK
jgi:hypothetical protein